MPDSRVLVLDADRQRAATLGALLDFVDCTPVLARDAAEDARRDAERAGLPPAAIVGSYDEVAERLADLATPGFRHFVLTAPSSLEEAYRIGQRVLPRFRALSERVAAAA